MSQIITTTKEKSSQKALDMEDINAIIYNGKPPVKVSIADIEEILKQENIKRYLERPLTFEESIFISISKP